MMFDIPSDPRNNPSIVTTQFQKTHYTTNVLSVVKHVLDPAPVMALNQEETKRLRIPKDEMAIVNFEGRRIYLNTFNITGTTARNALLFYYDSKLPFRNIFTADPNWQLSDFSQMFSHSSAFRADVSFHVRFHSNSFQNAKVLFAAINGIYPTATSLRALETAAVVDPRTISHILHDTGSEDKEITITIPMKHYNGWLLPNNSTNGASNKVQSVFALWLVNQCTANSASSSTIYYTISCSFTNITMLDVGPSGVFCTQAGLVYDDLVAKDRINHYSRITSLKDLITVPVPYHTQSITWTTNGGGVPCIVQLDPCFINFSTAWSLVKSMFTNYKGGMRYIIRIQNLDAACSTPVSVSCTVVPFNSKLLNIGATHISDVVRAHVAPYGDWTKYPPMVNGAFGYAPMAAVKPNMVTPDGKTVFSASSYPSAPHTVLNTHSNSETIIEVPFYGVQYNHLPLHDRDPTNSTLTSAITTPALVIAPTMFSQPLFNGSFAIGVSIWAMPADDFQAIHYSGGPTGANGTMVGDVLNPWF
jgi:hypothetical protein